MGHKRLFVVTDVANINIKADSNSLGVGEIGIYGINQATQRVERATTSNVLESLTIALGRGAGLKSLRSFTVDLPVPKRQLLWRKALYAAPVLAQIQIATDCVPDGAYDSFIIKVATRFHEDASDQWYIKSYSAGSLYASNTLLYAALAAKINADGEAVVTATSSAAGVVLTTKTPRTVLDAGFEYGNGEWRPGCMTCSDCNSTITKLNEPSDGEGTYWHLQQHFRESRGHLGTHWTNDRLVPQPEDTFSGVTKTGNWDFYFFNYQNANQSKGDIQMVNDTWQENVIAVPAGTVFTSFTQVMDAQIGQALTTAII